jgi:transcription elongation factor Elf1
MKDDTITACPICNKVSAKLVGYTYQTDIGTFKCILCDYIFQASDVYIELTNKLYKPKKKGFVFR